MKRTSKQRLLQVIFSQAFSRDFNKESLDDRIMLQKVIFFMHEFGVYCGDYSFSWDHFGPFSPELSDDMKKEVNDPDVSVTLTNEAKNILDSLNKIFLSETVYSNQRYWVEEVASLFYMKMSKYPGFSDEKIVNKLEELKGDYLNDHAENLRAMNVVNELMAW